MRSVRKIGGSSITIGVAALLLALVALVFAFTRWNPFANPYVLKAAFRDVQNLDRASPVRVAGVDVGKVTEVKPAEGDGAATVTMELQDRALPLFEDAELKVRPRLFLEGNYYVDLRPGSPSDNRLESGGTVPVTQTSHSVSIDQVLRVFKKDTREELQTLLDEYGDGLAKGGAEGFNDSIRWWAPAYRTTALTAQALLGTEPGDLKRVLRGQQQTFAALSRDPDALKGLVSSLNATTAAFAREDDALAASIPALRDVLRRANPTLRSLDATYPGVRRFAEDATPAVRSSGPTIDALRPFITQLRGLVQEDELKGLSRDLRVAVPALARVNRVAIPLLRRSRALSSCTENVLVPFARTPIPDPDFPDASGEPFYQDAPRSFVGLAGESRIHDANGQLFRVLAGGGPNTLVQETAGLGPAFSQMPFPSLGARPAKPEERPRFRPDVPCETQEPPDMNAALAPGDTAVDPVPQVTDPLGALEPVLRRRALDLVGKALERDRSGREANDPLLMPRSKLMRTVRREGGEQR
jgi:virulence factor Mce-like protein